MQFEVVFALKLNKMQIKYEKLGILFD